MVEAQEKTARTKAFSIKKFLAWLIQMSSRSTVSTGQTQKVLVICLGDIPAALHAISFIQALKTHGKKFMIDMALGEWSLPLVSAHPDVHEIFIHNASWVAKDIFMTRASYEDGFMAFAWDLRRKQYDIVICLEPSFGSHMIAGISGAPVRIGYEGSKGGFYLTDVLHSNPSAPIIQNHFSILDLLGVRPFVESPRIYPPASDARSTEAILDGLNPSLPLVILHPGGNKSNFQWKTESYRQLIQWLSSKGCQTLVLGGAFDNELLEEVFQNFYPPNVQIWNFPSTGEIAALAQHTPLYIGIRAGQSDILAAMDCNCIILNSHPAATPSPPFGLHIHNIYASEQCPSAKMEFSSNIASICDCVKNIPLDEVTNLVTKIMD